MSEKIKVLIVDDSSIVRDVLSSKLTEYEDIEIVGTAIDPFIARNKILSLNPDVITLDIEMPRMDGLTFLEKLINYYPIPVIIVSSVTTQDKYAGIKALEIGAFDIVNKPLNVKEIDLIINDLYMKIKSAFLSKGIFLEKRKMLELITVKKSEKININLLGKFSTTDKIIAIGASTGGTIALEYIIKALPKNLPPILIAQHMPELYTKQFADRLNDLSELNVTEAENNELITKGTIYIAKGNYHLNVERKGKDLYLKLTDQEKVNFQRPAVDVLFESVADVCGKNALGILLTGMGSDGAEGLLKMKMKGAITVAQDEKTSIVWGMPKAAIDRNAAVEILSLENIAKRIIQYASG